MYEIVRCETCGDDTYAGLAACPHCGAAIQPASIAKAQREPVDHAAFLKLHAEGAVRLEVRDRAPGWAEFGDTLFRTSRERLAAGILRAVGWLGGQTSMWVMVALVAAMWMAGALARDYAHHFANALAVYVIAVLGLSYGPVNRALRRVRDSVIARAIAEDRLLFDRLTRDGLVRVEGR